MKINIRRISLAIILTISIPVYSSAQKLQIGAFLDPTIGWYSTSSDKIESAGSRAGYATGLSVHYYITRRLSFSSGISWLQTGGVQKSSEEILFLFTNFSTNVLPGEKVIYNTAYMTVPLGLRFKTKQRGYTSLFADAGIDPSFLARGTVSIPKHNIEKELGSKEIKKLNFRLHVQTGIEYSLGGSLALLAGLGYEHGLSDVTIDNNAQPFDITTNRIIHFKLGLLFR